MTLEDEIPDVIAKAMLGLGLDAAALAKKSGTSVEAITQASPNEATLRKIAPALGLHADALVALPSYLPCQRKIPGIRRLELPFRQWTVNAWLIEHGSTRLLFDTGFGENDILPALDGALPDAVLITHAHEDHIGGVLALESAGVKVISEETALAQGEITIGEITLRALDLSGHKTPTAAYLLTLHGETILLPGDAIFAGSIGRCRTPDAYQLALQNLRRTLFEVGPTCILLPGHGPATTVAEEFISNPFLSATTSSKDISCFNGRTI